ncbi:autoinducer binding domain-containing protein [Loktanella sp. F6476L]|uniref:helix-turn-helix transcriptional regulator n=1 Tax=Loktanella sp. F6476L TaxID=2926405 RepID=UPI001FF63511|nr:autoinducer binding domain-containing protein [Loktanella sp. F6476L]MCK0120797.1 autoinducer binding domain-containing protein [Loktanella sp. F6476L]UWQ98276.1 autoinducer binding domain-containing protein [Rhodobacteraceae bacterium S2214]
MERLLSSDDLNQLAPAGFHIALRIGFAFPLEEQNAFPPPWVEHYTMQRFMLFDPVIRWVYSSSAAAIRWSEIELEDPRKVLAQAQTFGLRYGATVSVTDKVQKGLRSFGSFARNDREFTDLEIRLLNAFIQRRHEETAPPSNLTRAELEVLQMIKNGERIKQIAHELGVSEGAIKQRLKNAKLKLDAKTGPQAAALASQFGLI